MKIGFIGLGVMGKAMARNLKKAGFDVSIYARNPQKFRDLVSEGFKLYGTIKELIAVTEIVITIVGFPSDVRKFI